MDVAIEQRAWYSNSPPAHSPDDIEHASDALVEGVASFFGATLGESFTSKSTPGADWNVENTVNSHLMPDRVSGWRIEGADAGFLYDLVDGPSSPNAIDNAVSSVDDDSATYGSREVANMLVSGSLNVGTNLDGSDEFICCTETSLAPQSLLNPTYSTYHFQLRRDTTIHSSVSVRSHRMSAIVSTRCGSRT